MQYLLTYDEFLNEINSITKSAIIGTTSGAIGGGLISGAQKIYKNYKNAKREPNKKLTLKILRKDAGKKALGGAIWGGLGGIIGGTVGGTLSKEIK